MAEDWRGGGGAVQAFDTGLLCFSAMAHGREKVNPFLQLDVALEIPNIVSFLTISVGQETKRTVFLQPPPSKVKSVYLEDETEKNA